MAATENGVALKTFQGWKCRFDPNDKWLAGDEINGIVSRVHCRLCAKFASRLQSASRNFSLQFANGITGPSLKKDNIEKHMKSDAHNRAETLERGPLSIDQFFKDTAIGKLGKPNTVPYGARNKSSSDTSQAYESDVECDFEMREFDYG